MRSFIQTGLAALVGSSIAVGARAGLAQAELQGRVLADGSRRPIANATVAVPRLDLQSQSDSLGRYRIEKIPRGEHLVVTRAVGFRPDSTLTAFDGDEALVTDVVLRVAVNELPTVAVRETSRPIAHGKMAAFEERKVSGIGQFLGREVFQKDESRRVSEVIATSVAGVQIHRGGGSKAWAASTRSTSTAKCAFCRTTKTELLDFMDIAAGAPLACYLDIYLDGVLIYDSTARKTPLFNLSSLRASEIEGIEVYSSASQIPAQYNKTSGGSGVMLIWTRTGR
jgi:hypothetical protein